MKPQNSELPALPQYVAARDVRRALGGACNATINALVADGVLPRPIKPRANMVLFERTALMEALRRMGDAA
jgi:hypothetical protein